MKVLLDHNARIFLHTTSGPKFAHGVILSAPVRRVRVEKEELRYYREALLKGKPYPIDRAKRRLLKAGRTLGITPGAKQDLQQEQ